MENNEQIESIKKNVMLINETIKKEDFKLLEYVITMVISRANLYLRTKTLSANFEIVIVDVVDGIFKKYKKNLNNDDVEPMVKTISDNGQSISYSNEVKSYLASATDDELFSGFIALLKRYRRVKVVNTQEHEV